MTCILLYRERADISGRDDRRGAHARLVLKHHTEQYEALADPAVAGI